MLWPAQAQVTVTVTPPFFTLAHGQSQVFSASVAGVTNPVVNWTSSPGGIGSLSASSGLSATYTAPASVFSGQSNTVVITASVSSGGVAYAGTATVTLIPTVTVSLSPATVTVAAGQTQQFTATVSGTVNQGLSYVLKPPVGTITSAGLYTAPATVSSNQTVTLTATSSADPTQSASATITVTPGASTYFGVGAGAPNQTITDQFIQAFNRNNFSTLVTLPPQGNVTTF